MKSPLEHIIHIREVLCLNQSELAYVLGVTRNEACRLINGKEPTNEQLKNIHRLASIATSIKKLNIHRFDRKLKLPIFNEISLLDKLKSQDEFSECLEEIKKKYK